MIKPKVKDSVELSWQTQNRDQNSYDIYIYWGTHGITVTVVRNGIENNSSNLHEVDCITTRKGPNARIFHQAIGKLYKRLGF